MADKLENNLTNTLGIIKGRINYKLNTQPGWLGLSGSGGKGKEEIQLNLFSFQFDTS